MSDNKKHDSNESNNDLKHIDSEKHDSPDGEFFQMGMSDLLESKLKNKIFATERKKSGKNGSLPIFVDVIVGILIIAISIGVIVGAFLLFRYYSDDYGDVKIEYTFVSYCDEDYTLYRTMKNKELYMDTENNTLYFGKIASVELIENTDGKNTLVLTVKATAKYKKGSGYSVGDNRIAVGSEYTLRSETIAIKGTVVELTQTTVAGGN